MLSFAAEPATAAQDSFTYDTSVTYRVGADGVTDVTQEYEITNRTARQYLTELKLSTPVEEVTGLAAAYADGAKIPATSAVKPASRGDIRYSNQQIRLVFPRQIYGAGRRWAFRVSYQAKGLVESKGGAHTVFVPSIETGGEGDDYRVTVEVPEGFGRLHLAGTQQPRSSRRDGRQFYHFSKQDLAKGLALTFGDRSVYRANFNFPLRNRSPWPRTLTVALPPNMNNQSVYVNSLEPAPTATRLDGDGNVLADYRLGPNQSIVVRTGVDAQVKYLEYDLGASGKRSDIPADLVRRYTGSTRYWQTDGEVGAAARRLTDDNAPVASNVRAMYRYVIEKLNYNNDKIKFNIRQGAAAALANPSNAVCLEYSDLLVAMLRSQGIPARMPVGYAYSGSLKESKGVADSLHSWVEAYVPGVGWMTLDPTWGEKFDQFGRSDLDHFAFAVWGEQDRLPGAVMSGRRDTNYQYEAASVEFAGDSAPLQPDASITVTRFQILPLVALERISVRADRQVASGNNQALIGRTILPLGSLAPRQRLVTRRLVWGSDWSRPDEARLARNGGEQVQVLASTRVKTDRRPMVLLGTLLALGASLAVIKRRHRHN